MTWNQTIEYRLKLSRKNSEIPKITKKMLEEVLESFSRSTLQYLSQYLIEEMGERLLREWKNDVFLTGNEVCIYIL